MSAERCAGEPRVFIFLLVEKDTFSIFQNLLRILIPFLVQKLSSFVSNK